MVHPFSGMQCSCKNDTEVFITDWGRLGYHSPVSQNSPTVMFLPAGGLYIPILVELGKRYDLLCPMKRGHICHVSPSDRRLKSQDVIFHALFPLCHEPGNVPYRCCSISLNSQETMTWTRATDDSQQTCIV